jgi:hypothetical protein
MAKKTLNEVIEFKEYLVEKHERFLKYLMDSQSFLRVNPGDTYNNFYEDRKILEDKINILMSEIDSAGLSNEIIVNDIEMSVYQAWTKLRALEEELDLQNGFYKFTVSSADGSEQVLESILSDINRISEDIYRLLAKLRKSQELIIVEIDMQAIVEGL